MNREYQIIVSEAAFDMLDRHILFLSNVSWSAAQKISDQVKGDVLSLSTLPERYPLYEGSSAQPERYRQMLSCKRYLILYEITEHTVYVDYILDCRQDNTTL